MVLQAFKNSRLEKYCMLVEKRPNLPLRGVLNKKKWLKKVLTFFHFILKQFEKFN